MYALDTNTLIYFFKGVGNVADHLLSVAPKSVYVPTIVLFELEVGIAKSKSPDKRKKQLEQFTDAVNTIPFGREEALCAANVRADLEKRGTPIGPYDILIAASAISKNLILVTHNTKEFSRVESLRMIDWY